MNLPRIFANAIARRIAYVLVAMVLAWLGVGSARAQATIDYADEGAAYAGCMSNASGVLPYRVNSTLERISCSASKLKQSTCVKLTSSFYVRGVNRAPNGDESGACFDFTGQVPGINRHRFAGTCQGRPSVSTLFGPPGGSLGCNRGCRVKYTAMGKDSEGRESSMMDYMGGTCDPSTEKQECNARNPGGTSPPQWVWNGYLGVCQPVSIECPAGHSPDIATGACTLNDSCPVGYVTAQNGACVPKKEECPAGNIKAPSGECLPGEGQCAAGEARRENGTCGKDSDGDGKADSDDDDPNNDPKDSFGGGDNCSVPPACNGSPILCGQARIQWRIDCNTRKNRNVSGGACGAPPVCSGEKCDSVETAQLQMQWRTACALEKGTGNTGAGDKTAEFLSAQRAADVADANAIAAQGDGHEGVSESTIFKTFDADGFNPNLFGGGSAGQCSFSAPLELMGEPIELPPMFWTLAAMIGWLTVASAYIYLAIKLGS